MGGAFASRFSTPLVLLPRLQHATLLTLKENHSGSLTRRSGLQRIAG